MFGRNIFQLQRVVGNEFGKIVCTSSKSIAYYQVYEKSVPEIIDYLEHKRPEPRGPLVESYNDMIVTLFRKNNPEKAKELFDRMHYQQIHPTAKTYTEMMRYFNSVNQLNQVHAMFNQMVELEIQPTIQTFTILLEALCKSNQFAQISGLMATVEKCGLALDGRAYTVLIKHYLRTDQMSKVVELLHQMKQRGIQSNVAMFTELLKVLAKRKDNEKVKKLLSLMKQMKVKPSDITYVVLLNYYRSIGDYNTLIRHCEEMKSLDISHNRATWYFMIEAFCKVNRVEDAWDALHEMKYSFPANEELYNIMIKHLTKANCLDKAKKLLDEMHEIGGTVTPTIITYNSIMTSNNFQFNQQIFQEMNHRGVQPDIFTLNSMLQVYCKGKNIHGATQLIENMKKHHHVKPDIFSYNALMKCYCFNKNIHLALTLMNNLRTGKYSVEPSIISFNILIGALAESGRDKEVKDLYIEMQTRWKLQPDIRTFNNVIMGLVKAKKYSQALFYFDDMEEKDVSFNIFTCNAILQCYTQLDRLECALDLFTKMKNSGKRSDMKPNTLSFDILIQYCKTKSPELVVKLLSDMITLNITPKYAAFLPLLRSFTVSELTKHLVPELREKMILLGFKPDKAVKPSPDQTEEIIQNIIK